MNHGIRSSRVAAVALAGLVLLTALALTGCKKEQARAGGPPGAGGGRQAPGAGGPGGGAPAAAVPVEAAAVERRDISSFIESNGVLEAENEVEIVARTTGPIVALRVEEGDVVRRGEILAQIDPAEVRAQVEISKVALDDAQLAFDRAERLHQDKLISPEDYEAALARYETAKAQLEGNRIQLGYTDVRAPFGGLIAERHVNFAQQVTPGSSMFRLSDFTPLLAPIQVPERELSRLRVGQEAYLTVEAWPDHRFIASVLRIRPVVDAATGTVRVTLEVDGQDKLRPGMFARVFVQTETHTDAIVVPKAALSLESIGDTVYVVGEGVAARRDVELGFQEGDAVEILSGVAEGEAVVVVGQDGLSDGTPIQVLRGPGAAAPPSGPTATAGGPPSGRPGGPGGPPGGRFDPSQLTPERLELIKQRMRERGLSEEEIEQRIEHMRQRAGQGASQGG